MPTLRHPAGLQTHTQEHVGPGLVELDFLARIVFIESRSGGWALAFLSTVTVPCAAAFCPCRLRRDAATTPALRVRVKVPLAHLVEQDSDRAS